MYQLYTLPGSCSMGIHVLLNALEVPFELVSRNEVDDYIKTVPTNQVPALQTPDRIISEGAAIGLFLMAKHGDAELTQDPEFLRWLMFCYATLHPAYGKLFGLNGMLDESETKQQLLQQCADKVADYWKIVENQLQGRRYFFGEQATLVDYLIAVYVRWGNIFANTRIPIGPEVLNLVRRVVALPEFAKALRRESVVYQVPANAMAA